ncbi:MAG: ABC transporter permease [Rhodobacteraceae bacterium]|nr:ABC transporter permease [Paracoccaceae bacterium]
MADTPPPDQDTALFNAAAQGQPPAGRSVFPWALRAWDSDLAWSFRHSPVAVVSLALTLLLILSAVCAPLLAPHDPFNPATLNLLNGFTPPGEANAFTGERFLLGTDDQGRDVFSTILYGLRVSLFVGFSAVLFAMVLGVTLGLLAGYFGGWTEAIIMRIADVQLTFPAILVAMLIFGIAKGITPIEYRDQVAIWVLILAIGLSDWVQFARVVRGATLVEASRDYVQAARLIGCSSVAIMVRHILPNVLSPVLVIATISLALAIIAEATLSFLGVGAPPTQPSLGTLIRIGQGFLFSGEWWILAFPACTLLVLALAVNLLGDWLRDALNPRLR